MRLECWGVTCRDHPYTAPENLHYCVQGEVYNSTRFQDGDHVVTSAIRAAGYNDSGEWWVETENQSTYFLGDPDPDFLELLIARGMTLEKALANLRQLK